MNYLRKVSSFKSVINAQTFFSSSVPMNVEKLLDNYDQEQVRLMKEVCILVDDQDQAVGSMSKKDCHLLENINKGVLHRAFSVFLFNGKNELLLQQRSDAKITFPGMFTNTCCSHPLYTVLERDENEAMGVKRAAQRKLFHELGITPDQIPLNIFHYITRIRYRADNIPDDKTFGEHEIDYVLFIKKDVNVVQNENEVKSYRYVTEHELKEMIAASDEGRVPLTPWFRLICREFLFKWWPNIESVKTLQDHSTIHQLS